MNEDNLYTRMDKAAAHVLLACLTGVSDPLQVRQVEKIVDQHLRTITNEVEQFLESEAGR